MAICTSSNRAFIGSRLTQCESCNYRLAPNTIATAHNGTRELRKLARNLSDSRRRPTRSPGRHFNSPECWPTAKRPPRFLNTRRKCRASESTRRAASSLRRAATGMRLHGTLDDYPSLPPRSPLFPSRIAAEFLQPSSPRKPTALSLG